MMRQMVEGCIRVALFICTQKSPTDGRAKQIAVSFLIVQVGTVFYTRSANTLHRDR